MLTAEQIKFIQELDNDRFSMFLNLWMRRKMISKHAWTPVIVQSLFTTTEEQFNEIKKEYDEWLVRMEQGNPS